MQKSKLLTAQDVLVPVTFARMLLGMAPYRIQNGRLVWHKMGFLTTVLVLIAITTMTVYFLSNVEEFLDMKATIVGTIKALIIIRRIGGVVVLLLTICPSHSNFTKFLKIRHDLHQIDEQLSKFRCKEEICESNYKHRNKVTVLLLLNGIFLVVGEVVIMTMLISSFEMIQAVIFAYPQLVMRIINIIFYGCTLILQSRFKCVNKLVAKTTPLDTNFCKNVKRLTLLHKDLVETSRNLNRVFNFQLLLWISLNSVLLIGDLHAGTYVIVFRLSGKMYKVIIISMKYCVIYISDFYYLCKRCTELCREVSTNGSLTLGLNRMIFRPIVPEFCCLEFTFRWTKKTKGTR